MGSAVLSRLSGELLNQDSFHMPSRVVGVRVGIRSSSEKELREIQVLSITRFGVQIKVDHAHVVEEYRLIRDNGGGHSMCGLGRLIVAPFIGPMTRVIKIETQRGNQC